MPFHLRKWQAGRERGLASTARVSPRSPQCPTAGRSYSALRHGHFPRANAVFNFEYRSESWADPVTGPDRRQPFAPDRSFDRPRPQRKVTRRGCAAYGHQQHFRTRPGPPGPPAASGPAAPATAGWPATPDHTIRRAPPASRRRARSRPAPARGGRRGTAAVQPRRNQPRHGRAAFCRRQFRPLCGDRLPRMKATSSYHVRLQLSALPASQDLEFPARRLAHMPMRA